MDKSDTIAAIQKEQEEKTCISIGILDGRLDSVSHYFGTRNFKKILLLGKNRAADLFVKMMEKVSIETKCVDEVEEIQDDPDVVLVSAELLYDKLCGQLKEKISAPVFLLDDIVTDICWTPYQLGDKGLKEYEEDQIRTVNLYDQRTKQHLYKIWPKDRYIGKQSIEKALDKNALVVVNLYYIADTDMYLHYLGNLPETVDVCIVTSNKNVYSHVSSEIKRNGWNNISIRQKMNRGRDISALLVACRDILPQYEYIGFVHDKREKSAATKQDIDFWIENLWGNTVASKEYLANIFDEFDNCPQLGLLVPPEPAGMYQKAWYGFSSWGRSFAPTVDLARELGLNCPISMDKPPVTLSTVFWCRYDALKKLFEKDWKYMSFPEEPLPSDGTISHAVERILGFVAQDAGYKTAIMMNDEYAAKFFSLLQVNIQKVFGFLKLTYRVENFHDVNYIYNMMLKISNVYNQYENVYLYGTGMVGMRFLGQLEYFGMKPKAFIETNCEEGKQVKNIPVYSIENVDLRDNDVVIISVGYRLRGQIQQELEKRKIVNYVFCQDLQEM